MPAQTTVTITGDAKPGNVNGDSAVNIFDLVITAR